MLTFNIAIFKTNTYIWTKKVMNVELTPNYLIIKGPDLKPLENCEDV